MINEVVCRIIRLFGFVLFVHNMPNHVFRLLLLKLKLRFNYFLYILFNTHFAKLLNVIYQKGF